MASEVRSCARCGCSTQQNHAAAKARRPAICKDCRGTDPAYVQALRTGVPLVARRAS